MRTTFITKSPMNLTTTLSIISKAIFTLDNGKQNNPRGMDTNMGKDITIIPINMCTKDSLFLIGKRAMGMQNTAMDKYTKVSGGKTKNRGKAY